MKMRKTIAFMLVMVMALSFCGTAFAAEVTAPEEQKPVQVKGDIDGDYAISNIDLILMARFIVGLSEPDNDALYRADVDMDGELTNTDLVALAKKILAYSGETLELSEEMEAQMIEDFVMWRYGDQLTDTENSTFAGVAAYFGTYNGCEVVLMGRKLKPSIAAQKSIVVNELEFTFPNIYLCLYLYKDSQFKVIDEAYEADWITDEDLQNIWNLREGDFDYSGKNNKELSKELETKLFRDFVAQYDYQEDFEELIESVERQTTIRAYYGTYSGCEAVLISSGVGGAVIVNVDVNGHRFSFPDTATALYIYKDSQFLRIDEAYEAGWITAADVATIWNLRCGYFAK